MVLPLAMKPNNRVGPPASSYSMFRARGLLGTGHLCYAVCKRPALDRTCCSFEIRFLNVCAFVPSALLFVCVVRCVRPLSINGRLLPGYYEHDLWTCLQLENRWSAVPCIMPKLIVTFVEFDVCLFRSSVCRCRALLLYMCSFVSQRLSILLVVGMADASDSEDDSYFHMCPTSGKGGGGGGRSSGAVNSVAKSAPKSNHKVEDAAKAKKHKDYEQEEKHKKEETAGQTRARSKG